MQPSRNIQKLIDIMIALRDKDTGCPWDVEQTFATIAPYTIEEAYEVSDAIERNDMVDLKDELGDLLLQVVYHARMAEECGYFDFGDVVSSITAKMIRRHPHVFGSEDERKNGLPKGAWQAMKLDEKKTRIAEKEAARQAGIPVDTSGSATTLLGDIPRNLPALTRAQKLQHKAAHVGFDWPDIAPVFDKLHEEIDELKEAIMINQTTPSDQHRQNIQSELGDILFAATNLARHAELDAENSLEVANSKFQKRFNYIEQNIDFKEISKKEEKLDIMENLWQQAKREGL